MKTGLNSALRSAFAAGALALGQDCILAQEKLSGFALIPAGKFEMGDHHGFVDPKHGSDETPLHAVSLGAFHMGIYDVTTRQYCEFLNAVLGQRMIEVRKGGVYLVGGNDLLCDTRASSQCSRIGWDSKVFAVLDQKENHPMVCVRWHGAAGPSDFPEAVDDARIALQLATLWTDEEPDAVRESLEEELVLLETT